ncbi:MULTISPECIES: small multi-drug export protein [Clostridium]|uniref:COG2426 family protein n=1 Tax=Clostridium TaxID=1485 RepID=UPI00189B9650|nr:MULTISPECIES: small multi-drug export protein [Clostridium]MCR1951990.1 small multi-drug export protein [Clostridium sp. DSM 100503]MDI9217804.1 small multi-drug export protein [Clostridium tertium]
MTDSLINWFTNTLSFMPKEAVAFIISMVPILELRGGLVAASLLGIGVFKAIVLCVIGNVVPIPFILFFITPVFNWMKKTKLFRPLVEKLEEKSMSKSDQIQKYEFWGLALFVGIPLPGTGAWTGALIAALLGIDIKKASLSIFIGIMIATIIMTFISYGIPFAIRAMA